MDQTDIFIERVTALRTAKGVSERHLSLMAGGPDILRDARRKGTLPKQDKIEIIATELDSTPDYLLGRTDMPQPPGNEAVLADRRVAWRDSSGRGDLPIYGTALGHSYFADGEQSAEIEQTLFEPTDVIRYLARPAALNADPHAYAVYIQGDSMSPRYEPGELAVVTTRKPPQLGDDVIVQLLGDSNGDDEAEVISVLIKRLVRRSSAWVELRQFNPPCTFRVETTRLRHIHRITPIGDLLGA